MTDVTDSEKGKIYAQIPKIIGEVRPVGKGGTNQQQDYSYRKVDDVYDALNVAMAKHSVFFTQRTLKHNRVERATKAGGLLQHVELLIDITYYADDGSSVSDQVMGEGTDSGDKAITKAITGAVKSSLLNKFVIPTKEVKDSEADSDDMNTPVPAKPSVPTPPRPYAGPNGAQPRPPQRPPTPPPPINVPPAQAGPPATAAPPPMEVPQPKPMTEAEKWQQLRDAKAITAASLFEKLGKTMKEVKEAYIKQYIGKMPNEMTLDEWDSLVERLAKELDNMEKAKK